MRKILIVLSLVILIPISALPASNVKTLETFLSDLILTGKLNDPTGQITALIIHDEANLDAKAALANFNQLQPSWTSSIDWATENVLTNISRVISDAIFLRAKDYRCSAVCDDECFPYRNCCAPLPYRSFCNEDYCCVPFKNFWVAFLGGHLEQKRFGGLSAFISNDWGFITGLDMVLCDWLTLGVAAGYTHSNIDWNEFDGTTSNHNFFIGPYASYSCGRWVFEASILKGAQRYRIDRDTFFFSSRTKSTSNHYGDSILCHLGTTWNYCWNAYDLVPYFLADYVYVHGSGIKGKGEPAFDVRVRRHNTQFFQGELGFAISRPCMIGSVMCLPSVQTGIKNITPITGTKLTATMAGQPGSFFVKTADESIFLWTLDFYCDLYITDWPIILLSYRNGWGPQRWEFSLAAETTWNF